MPAQLHCLVCRTPLIAAECAACGADSDSVQEAINAAEPPTIPSFWQLLFGKNDLVVPLSESIWTGLRPEFQCSILEKYARLSRRGRSITTLVMFPLLIALLATCFWAGVDAAKFFGAPGGKAAEWLFGACAMIVLLPLRVFPVGGYVETLMLQCRAERAARAVLDGVEFIGSAIIRRCRSPWYLNPDVEFPIAIYVVLLLGWFLL